MGVSSAGAEPPGGDPSGMATGGAGGWSILKHSCIYCLMGPNGLQGHRLSWPQYTPAGKNESEVAGQRKALEDKRTFSNLFCEPLTHQEALPTCCIARCLGSLEDCESPPYQSSLPAPSQ